MSLKIEMTAKTMASLDLLISKKQANDERYCDEMADQLANAANGLVTAGVTAGAVTATPVAGAATAAATVTVATAVATRLLGSESTLQDEQVDRPLTEEETKTLTEMGKHMPLDALIALRNMAILKEG
ncbi:hypothetical protein [Pedobacter frigoris]|uniref:Uncharacterized protein n=1 Tax=Pedobacter frigoris TaxID=2571272 RepID=A0A4U1CG91_9SPHI|nr:hypothetical protein [Pedobacter frigoris]TKC06222.1 hypothetical protein FA047_12940 [Pedobacter frigoris]